MFICLTDHPFILIHLVLSLRQRTQKAIQGSKLTIRVIQVRSNLAHNIDQFFLLLFNWSKIIFVFDDSIMMTNESSSLGHRFWLRRLLYSCLFLGIKSLKVWDEHAYIAKLHLRHLLLLLMCLAVLIGLVQCPPSGCTIFVSRSILRVRNDFALSILLE